MCGEKIGFLTIFLSAKTSAFKISFNSKNSIVGGQVAIIHGAFLSSCVAELVSVLVSSVMMAVLAAVMIFSRQ